MRKKPVMGCLFNCRSVTVLLSGVVLLFTMTACLSYRYTRDIQGIEIENPGDSYSLGQTTLTDVLMQLGAPDDIYSLNDIDLLIYRRSISQGSSLSLGIPIFDLAVGGSLDITASNDLTRYDVLTFFFNTQGVLEDYIFENASSRPYFKTLFPD